MLEASMLAIGDELLDGNVEDANSPWLARLLRGHGVPLSRVHVVPDEAGAIDEALTAELARSRPRVVFTSGGLGSTPDDLTFEAVAASLGRDVVLDDQLARRMDVIIERTRGHGVEVDEVFVENLMRMARVPDGSRVLSREGSWVPAVAVDVDGGATADGGASVVVLPGVPGLFRALVAEVVVPELVADRNEPLTVVEIAHDFPESCLNAVFLEVLARFGTVKLGSYPGDPMLVRLTGESDQVERAAQLVRGAIAELESTPAGASLAASWRGRPRPAPDEEDGT